MDALAGRIHLDFRSDEPIFMQIVHQMEALVSDGTFKPGDQLPTVREVAIDLRINFSTVARAYRILDERRLISTQRGRGTFIEEQPAPGWEQVPEDEKASSRLKSCRSWLGGSVDEAAGSGASPEQIEHVIQQQLTGWQRDHPTESGNALGGS